MPKISVIIPTYNRAKYLRYALDSILNQTYKDFEIIIIDDGSSDNTEEIAREYIKKYQEKIKLFCQENKGVSAARNRGIREAKGEYVAFLDSDDLWLPEKLETYLLNFADNHDCKLISGNMYLMNEGGIRIPGLKPMNPPGNDFKSLIEKGSGLCSSLMLKKDVLDNVGEFREDLFCLEDLDLCIRVARNYKILHLDKPLGIYRLHKDNSFQSNKIKSLDSQVKFWKDILNYYQNCFDKDFRNKIKRKLSQNLYLLGMIFFKEKIYSKAFKNIYYAIESSPFLGINFINSDDSFVLKLLKFAKPYIALCLSGLLRILAQKKILEN